VSARRPSSTRKRNPSCACAAEGRQELHGAHPRESRRATSGTPSPSADVEKEQKTYMGWVNFAASVACGQELSASLLSASEPEEAMACCRAAKDDDGVRIRLGAGDTDDRAAV
jgi:hypothetical protein